VSFASLKGPPNPYIRVLPTPRKSGFSVGFSFFETVFKKLHEEQKKFLTNTLSA
jgi:hypothetical protein